jgi:hypothetical protein
MFTERKLVHFVTFDNLRRKNQLLSMNIGVFYAKTSKSCEKANTRLHFYAKCIQEQGPQWQSNLSTVVFLLFGAKLCSDPLLFGQDRDLKGRNRIRQG